MGCFIRVISNIPTAVGEAASVMCLGGATIKEDGNVMAKLLGSIGRIWRADEKYFDAVTSLSGSGSAFIYLAIEALADGEMEYIQFMEQHLIPRPAEIQKPKLVSFSPIHHNPQLLELGEQCKEAWAKAHAGEDNNHENSEDLLLLQKSKIISWM